MNKKEINIRIPDELKNEIETILKNKGISLSKFISDAINLSIIVEKNMDLKSNSRLLIENVKSLPKDYSLVLKKF